MSSRLSTRRDPATFCGGLIPWRLISELGDGEDVVACYVVRDSRKLETKSSKPYLKLRLGDRSGAIDGMIWEDAESWESACEPSAVVGVRGKVGMYQEQLQLKISSIELLEPSTADWDHLLQTSHRPAAEMERELEARISSVGDRGLRALLRRCLGKGTEIGAAFRLHAAATRNHHAYVGGLMEHTLSVAGSCVRLAEHYAEQGVEMDRDLLISAALLHDIGKVRELEPLPRSGYTTEGRLLGHIVIGMQLVAQEARHLSDLSEERLVLLQHLIASHQGKPEWDSPRIPQLLEAFVLHYADDLDAKINQVSTVVASLGPGEWSAYDRSLGRAVYLPGRDESAAVPTKPTEPADESVIDLFRS